MGDSLNDRLINLRNIISKYNDVDQTYLMNKLSTIIRVNFNLKTFQISYQNLITDKTLSQYLTDTVYSNILLIIADLTEYRSLERKLNLNISAPSSNNYTANYTLSSQSLSSPSLSSPSLSAKSLSAKSLSSPSSTLDLQFTTDSTNKEFNAKFNSQFIDQLAKNRIDRILSEQNKLQNLIENDYSLKPREKLFHELTIQEFADNLANSIVFLFKNIFTLDFKNIYSDNNYIYYGFILIFVYIVLQLKLFQ